MPAITATATAVMVLTNVGLQFFNNWRGTKNSEELRKKQQEFQEAAQDRNHDRMMQLLREGQALQEQMESQMHEDRIKNISQDFDELIKRIFLADALKDWPLRVLPMVMKNQSIGSFRANSNENIALHVILTPSNSPQFNASVFPHIEQGLEAFCNQHWNTLSSHPIVFYSGAWKTGTAPDNNEISLLQSSLPNLPVLMITPYFKHNGGNLVFKINMWGAGDNQQVEIQPTEQEFSYYNVYAPNMNYGKEIASTTIEEFVPYLQCMIGYLADIYFWSTYGTSPILPSLLTMGAINTDGMKYLLSSNQERYETFLHQAKTQSVDFPTNSKGVLTFYEGTSAFWDEETKNKELSKLRKEFPEFQKKYNFEDGEIVPKRGISISPSEYNASKYIKKSLETYDIVTTIEEFISFISKNKEDIPFDDPALYIEMEDYTIFKFHIYNIELHQLYVLPDGFDYLVTCKKLMHSKQIKSLFKYNKRYILTCRYSKLDKLIKSITNRDLIY